MKKLLLFCLVSLISMSAFAQNSSDAKNEVSIWGGYSPDSTTAVRFAGRVPDARFGMIAFRYARKLHDGESVKVRYTVDAIPAAFLSYPDIQVIPTPPFTKAVRETRFAYGVTPVGLQVNFRNQKKYQPFVDISAGLLIFQEITPNYGGTKVNFTPAIGGGLEVARKDGTAVTVGYKALHISNANRGSLNPGFQNNLIYVGYTFHSW